MVESGGESTSCALSWTGSTRFSLGSGRCRFKVGRWLPTRGGRVGRHAASISSRNLESNRESNREVPRIVRVGTHAVSANSKATLWGRLRTHRGDRAGGGSHRSSVFRRHVGAALLARDGGDLPTWGVRSSASSSIRSSEALHEQQVSAYLGAMSVLWIDVPDEPGPRSARAFVERNAIALLSNHLDPVDRASPIWLGLHSPHREIRTSGLWNLDYVDATYDDTFLDWLENFVTLTCSPASP